MSTAAVRFRQLKSSESSSGTLVWFPHAGGTSASVVRQTRGQALKLETQVVVLPAREERWNESAPRLEPLIDEVVDSIQSLGQRSLVLAGHSFGALLAYLVTERLAQLDRAPRAFMPMAIAPPDRLESTEWHRATDDELIEHLDAQYGAIPAALREDRAALGRFLPIVRHDLRLMETYHYQPSEPLQVNLVICGGTQDTAASEHTLRGWRRFTQANWDLRLFEGDHFFPYRHFQAITELAASSFE